MAEKLDLAWYAFQYRNAPTQDAQRAYEALEAFVSGMLAQQAKEKQFTLFERKQQ